MMSLRLPHFSRGRDKSDRDFSAHAWPEPEVKYSRSLRGLSGVGIPLDLSSMNFAGDSDVH